jgi:hypothetical protein
MLYDPALLTEEIIPVASGIPSSAFTGQDVYLKNTLYPSGFNPGSDHV